MRLLLNLLISALIWVSAAVAQEQTLPQQQETRARALFTELRCVVCQNQSIDSSDADVARDLREIVREQIESGKTDAQIRTYLVDRYGEFILLKPAFAWHTFLLWAAPLLLLIGGGWLIFRMLLPRKIVATRALSAEEEAQVNKLLKR